MPPSNGRILLVQDDGRLALDKNGHIYGTGFWGGVDVDRAVAGDTRAERDARAYDTDRTVGTIASVLGLGGALIGAPIVVDDSVRGAKVDVVSATLLVGGLALLLTAAGFYNAAQAHLYDAVNLYNETPTGLADGDRDATSTAR